MKGFNSATDCTWEAGKAWLQSEFTECGFDYGYSSRTGNAWIKIDGMLALKEEKMSTLGAKLCNDYVYYWEEDNGPQANTETLQAVENLETVLKRLIKLAKEEPEHYGAILAERMDDLMDDLQSEDFFGTESQLDPRGDFREGTDWRICGEIA